MAYDEDYWADRDEAEHAADHDPIVDSADCYRCEQALATMIADGLS